MSEELTPPSERADQFGRADVEASLRAAMSEGALSHGWIIAGAKGAGKATLAYRVARGLLDPAALEDDSTFQMPAEGRTFRYVAQGAHPDLFVAERAWNEKTSRYQTEITVETIRELTLFLNRTAALGGYRVAIIDTADDLNRNAANALLKALEEPPADTLLLLLSQTPGRLLPTIRSRCRRIDLRPLEEAAIAELLKKEGLGEREDTAHIAAHADGRPGYALTLAAGEGAAGITLAHDFIESVRARGDISKISARLVGKAADEKWAIFKEALTQALSDGARAAARGKVLDGPLKDLSAAPLLSAYEQLTALSTRGEALNLDRGQIIQAMSYDLRAALSGA